MRRYTKKALNSFIRDGLAADISDYCFNEINDLRGRSCLRQVGYCIGSCGISGALLEDMNTGELYAITKRNTALLQLI